MHGCMDAWVHGCLDAWMDGRHCCKPWLVSMNSALRMATTLSTYTSAAKSPCTMPVHPSPQHSTTVVCTSLATDCDEPCLLVQQRFSLRACALNDGPTTSSALLSSVTGTAAPSPVSSTGEDESATRRSHTCSPCSCGLLGNHLPCSRRHVVVQVQCSWCSRLMPLCKMQASLRTTPQVAGGSLTRQTQTAWLQQKPKCCRGALWASLLQGLPCWCSLVLRQDCTKGVPVPPSPSHGRPRKQTAGSSRHGHQQRHRHPHRHQQQR